MAKFCNGCEASLPLSQFYKKPRHKEYTGMAGYSHQCKTCTKVARAEYVASNPDKSKSSDRAYRLNKYGISVGQYNEMFMTQDGKCLGCDKHQSEFSKRLAVDHDHATGKVRGLLCTPCNLILGYAKDKKATLSNLINYLNKSELAADTNVVAFKAAKKAG